LHASDDLCAMYVETVRLSRAKKIDRTTNNGELKFTKVNRP